MEHSPGPGARSRHKHHGHHSHHSDPSRDADSSHGTDPEPDHSKEDDQQAISSESTAQTEEKATATGGAKPDKAALHDALIKKCPVVVKVVVVLITMLALLAQTASPRFGTRTRKEIFGDTLLSISSGLVILRSVWDTTLRCVSQLKATAFVAVWDVAKVVREWWAIVAAAWAEAAPTMEAWRARTWGGIARFFAAHCWWKYQAPTDKTDTSGEAPQASRCPVLYVHQRLRNWWVTRYSKSNNTATCPVTKVARTTSSYFWIFASKCRLVKPVGKHGKDEVVSAESSAPKEEQKPAAKPSYCPAIWLHRNGSSWFQHAWHKYVPALRGKAKTITGRTEVADTTDDQHTEESTLAESDCEVESAGDENVDATAESSQQQFQKNPLMELFPHADLD